LFQHRLERCDDASFQLGIGPHITFRLFSRDEQFPPQYRLATVQEVLHQPRVNRQDWVQGTGWKIAQLADGYVTEAQTYNTNSSFIKMKNTKVPSYEAAQISKPPTYGTNPSLGEPQMSDPPPYGSNPSLGDPQISKPPTYDTNPFLGEPQISEPPYGSNPSLGEPQIFDTVANDFNPSLGELQISEPPPYGSNPSLGEPQISKPPTYDTNPSLSEPQILEPPPYTSSPLLSDPQISDPAANDFNPFLTETFEPDDFNVDDFKPYYIDPQTFEPIYFNPFYSDPEMFEPNVDDFDPSLREPQSYEPPCDLTPFTGSQVLDEPYNYDISSSYPETENARDVERYNSFDNQMVTVQRKASKFFKLFSIDEQIPSQYHLATVQDIQNDQEQEWSHTWPKGEIIIANLVDGCIDGMYGASYCCDSKLLM
jgi:hypothetical protein